MKYDNILVEAAKKSNIIPKYQNLSGTSFRGNKIILNLLEKKLSVDSESVLVWGKACEIEFLKKRLNNKHNLKYQVFTKMEEDPTEIWSNSFEEVKQCLMTENIDTVIILSNPCRHIIKLALLDMNIKIIDMLDELNITGYNLVNADFGRSGLPKIKHVIGDCAMSLNIVFKGHLEFIVDKVCPYIYRKGINARKNLEYYMESYDALCSYKLLYEKEIIKSWKEFYLRRIIFVLFQLRDFDQLSIYLKQYKENSFRSITRIDSFLITLDQCISKVNTELQSRNQKDIIIDWIDQVPYEDFEKWDAFREYRNQGYEFRYAFPEVGYTRPVVRSILFGEDYMDSKLYNKDNADESKLIKILTDNDYEIQTLGTAYKVLEEIDELKPMYFEVVCYPSTYLLHWFAKNKIIQSDRSVLSIIHTCAESHQPYLSSYMKKFLYFNELYDDRHPEFYNNEFKSSFMPIVPCIEEMHDSVSDQTIHIIMSDHGRGNRYWKERRCRAFLMILGYSIPHNCMNDKLFSYIHFPELINMLIHDNNNFNQLGTDYVRIQGECGYSKTRLNRMKQNYLLLKDDNLIYENMEFRGVRTMSDKYVRFMNGKEMYFVMPEETEVNISDVPKERLNYLRSLIGDVYSDLSDNKRYQYTYAVFKELNII